MRVAAFLVCDDIREEVGGKLTLVGAYSGGIGLDPRAEFPTLLARLSVFLQLELDDNDPIPDTFEVRLTFNGEQIVENTRPLIVRDRALPVQIRLNFIPFTLRGWGEFGFDFSIQAQATELFQVSKRVRVFPLDAPLAASSGAANRAP